MARGASLSLPMHGRLRVCIYGLSWQIMHQRSSMYPLTAADLGRGGARVWCVPRGECGISNKSNETLACVSIAQ